MLEDRSAEEERDLAQARAEQLLGELSTILESSPAGIASMRGHTLIQCNRRFERMLRLTHDSAIGADIERLLAGVPHGPDAPSPGDSLDAVLDRGDLYETEVVVQDDDGTPHWYAVTIRRTGPAGPAPLAIVVLSEITRLKTQQAELAHLATEYERMASALGQQADRTRAVLDSVLVGIVTADEQGRISWLNRSARRMFGGDLGISWAVRCTSSPPPRPDTRSAAPCRCSVSCAMARRCSSSAAYRRVMTAPSGWSATRWPRSGCRAGAR